MARSLALVVVAGSFLFASRQAAAQPEEGHYYRIKNVNSGQVLMVEKGEREDGVKIVQAAPKRNEAQLWRFVKMGDFYNIINVKTEKALNVANGSQEEGTPIIQWDAKGNDSENQQWSLEKKGKHFAIKARHSGLVLDVAQSSKEPNAPLIQYPFEDGKNQLFDLVSRRTPAPPPEEVVGGFRDTAADRKEVADVARFAIGEISKKEKVMLVKVLNAMSQLVNGQNFTLTLDVKVEGGARTVYVEVYSSFDGKMELTGWEWVGDIRREQKK